MVKQFSCQIRVHGHLTGQWVDWFGGLKIENAENGDALIQGELADQSALFGVLDRIRNLGLEIISLVCTAHSPTAPESLQESQA